jgi:acetyltransferase-like isoleucine patch superfamily enzyme
LAIDGSVIDAHHRRADPRRPRVRRSVPYDSSAMDVLTEAVTDPTLAAAARDVRNAPPPPSGGPLALLRFMRANNMLRAGYLPLLARFLWLKLRLRGRLQTEGICFVCPKVKLEIGRGAKLYIGRWAWIGHGCKIRVHEGEVHIGAKTVIGQECTISTFQHVSIGRECIIADRVMLIDFDHGAVEVERPIRLQGIYKRDVRVGHNVWIGYGACILRGVSLGENSIVGTNAVVTRSFPPNAVLGGVPAQVIRMREAPRSMSWG